MNYVIACDPGVSGGFAFFSPDGRLVAIEKEREIRFFFEAMVAAKDNNTRCIIEDVHGWEGQGLQDTFTFAASYGQCLTLLRLRSGEFVRKVSPQKWQSALGVPKLDYDNRKRWVQKKVEELYPGYGKIPRWASDAVAIGHLYLKGELGLP